MKQFNQLIAHLTYTRMYEFDTTWNVFLLLDKAYSHFTAFVDYIHDSHDFSFVDPDTQATVQASKVNVQASIVIMKKRYERWLSEMRAIEKGGVHVS